MGPAWNTDVMANDRSESEGKQEQPGPGMGRVKSQGTLIVSSVPDTDEGARPGDEAGLDSRSAS